MRSSPPMNAGANITPSALPGKPLAEVSSSRKIYCSHLIEQQNYPITLLEQHHLSIHIDSSAEEVVLWDTSGSDNHDRIRQIAYAEADVVLLCFSIVSPDSLENIEAKVSRLLYVPEYVQATD